VAVSADPTILHVDMDAFYASVEQIKDPSLAGKPVIVGGQGSRGVVTSASYEARRFGVASAMPAVTARRLCPHGIFLPNDFTSYQEYSEKIREVFTSYTPLVEPLSLDEAFLDVSGSTRLFGNAPEIGASIRKNISDIGLTCTVGIGPNKFVAKLASTRAKPDGLLTIAPSEVESWLSPLPVGALWGVGEQTEDVLRRLGLRTVGDVAALSKASLEKAVGASLVKPYEPVKSVGSENTFERDLDDDRVILREVLRLADRTSSRLRAKGLCARTVTLKVRFSNFKTITRSRTLEEAADTGADLYGVARDLYLGLRIDAPRIRLLGVSTSGLMPGPPRRQLDLLRRPGGGPRWDEASQAIDEIRGRFGDGAVGPAALLDDLG
jgi:DNA polymerase IV